MTNEQLQNILDNAPEGATHVLIDHEFNVTFAKRKPKSCNWFWLHVDSGWLEFDKMPTMQDIRSLADLREILALRERVEKLDNEVNQALLDADKERIRAEQAERERPPIENGTNRYGLDIAYFRNAINRELNRPLNNYKPDELARVFARFSRTADKSVMFEPEFAKDRDIEQQVIGVQSVIIGLQNKLDSLCDRDSKILVESLIDDLQRHCKKLVKSIG